MLFSDAQQRGTSLFAHRTSSQIPKAFILALICQASSFVEN
jgi:hypothetical protein